MKSLSHLRRAKIPIQIFRDPEGDGNGVIGDPVLHLGTEDKPLRVIPFQPIDPELREQLEIASAIEVLQTVLMGEYDIQEGDDLYRVDTEKMYEIIRAPFRDWRGAGNNYMTLVFQEVKQT